MRLRSLELYPYAIPMVFGHTRAGVLVRLVDDAGRQGWGDVAPLPGFSKETLEQCVSQLHKAQPLILEWAWTMDNLLPQLAELALLPAASFGVEAALLALLDPLPVAQVVSAALFMGAPEDILELARQRHEEGFRLAKLKVGHLPFDVAAHLIDQLADRFRLRIDVNRAWSVADAQRFFERYPENAFEYVEEPFSTPKQLACFGHPLAVDESYPDELSLEELARLPTLKALIYKPTIQGGWLGLAALKAWADQRGVQVVLSSSFESEVGLSHIASLARRLALDAPIGIGTLPYMRQCHSFSNSC